MIYLYKISINSYIFKCLCDNSTINTNYFIDVNNDDNFTNFLISNIKKTLFRTPNYNINNYFYSYSINNFKKGPLNLNNEITINNISTNINPCFTILINITENKNDNLLLCDKFIFSSDITDEDENYNKLKFLPNYCDAIFFDENTNACVYSNDYINNNYLVIKIFNRSILKYCQFNFQYDKLFFKNIEYNDEYIKPVFKDINSDDIEIANYNNDILDIDTYIINNYKNNKIVFFNTSSTNVNCSNEIMNNNNNNDIFDYCKTDNYTSNPIYIYNISFQKENIDFNNIFKLKFPFIITYNSKYFELFKNIFSIFKDKNLNNNNFIVASKCPNIYDFNSIFIYNISTENNEMYIYNSEINQENENSDDEVNENSDDEVNENSDDEEYYTNDYKTINNINNINNITKIFNKTNNITYISQAKNYRINYKSDKDNIFFHVGINSGNLSYNENSSFNDTSFNLLTNIDTNDYVKIQTNNNNNIILEQDLSTDCSNNNITSNDKLQYFFNHSIENTHQINYNYLHNKFSSATITNYLSTYPISNHNQFIYNLTLNEQILFYRVISEKNYIKQNLCNNLLDYIKNYDFKNCTKTLFNNDNQHMLNIILTIFRDYVTILIETYFKYINNFFNITKVEFVKYNKHNSKIYNILNDYEISFTINLNELNLSQDNIYDMTFSDNCFYNTIGTTIIHTFLRKNIIFKTNSEEYKYLLIYTLNYR